MSIDIAAFLCETRVLTALDPASSRLGTARGSNMKRILGFLLAQARGQFAKIGRTKETRGC